MKWQGRRRSGNVIDRRGKGGLIVGGGIGGIIILVLALLTGQNPTDYINLGNQAGQPASESGRDDELAEFVSVVMADTEDVWHKLFRQQLGKTYDEPELVLFTQTDQSGCGFASAATGPFYCPIDERVYIDLSFFSQLRERFGAPGDFAMAYVVAHEVGHHIQQQLGISEAVHRQRQQLSETQGNELSVRLELQADFLAGVWAHHVQAMKDVLESGDIEEALRAASAIGDDRLQMQSQGYVVPDAFTHGSSEQRMHWFKRGYETGDFNAGNTFEATEL